MDPSVEEIETSLWLIQGHHVSGGMESHESEIAAGFHLANLFAITAQLQVLRLGLVVRLLTGPLESFGPGLVTQPIADEVGVTLSSISIIH